MIERTRIRVLAGALAAALLPTLPGCVGPPYEGPPPPPPPPHYPPWYYDYYYYPHVDVYFHLYTGFYWYFDGIYWRRVRQLPPHIHLHSRYRVLLRVPDERPFKFHDEHRRKYPQPRPEPPQPRPRVEPQPRPQPPQPRPRTVPQPRPQPGLPAPPPGLEREREEREWRDRDREERENNLRRYEEYRKKKLWIPPQQQ